MRFQFKLTYAFEDLLVLNRVVRKTYRRWPARISRGVGFFLCALCVPLGIFLLYLGELLTGFLDLLLGLVILALTIWYDRINAWASRRLLLKDTGEITVTLDEDGLLEQSLKGEAFYPYGAFIGGFHCRGRYLLFLDKKHGVILPEYAVTAGDPAALGVWLTEKLGKEIIEVR